MDSPVMGALITGACMLVVGFGTWWLSNANQTRFLKPVGTRPIDGFWKGTIRQNFPGMQEQLSGDFAMTLRAARKRVSGTATFDITIMGKAHHLAFHLSGGFLYETYLQLQYRDDTPGVIHFGSIIAELSADGSQFVGRFVGYGHLSGQIVYGDVSLTKVSV
jgi:hypothetical protein